MRQGNRHDEGEDTAMMKAKIWLQNMMRYISIKKADDDLYVSGVANHPHEHSMPKPSQTKIDAPENLQMLRVCAQAETRNECLRNQISTRHRGMTMLKTHYAY